MKPLLSSPKSPLLALLVLTTGCIAPAKLESKEAAPATAAGSTTIPPQPGATLHEIARSESPHFVDCLQLARASYWDDIETPAPGVVFHYLNRPVTPHTGSWGKDSTGAERTWVCVPQARSSAPTW